MHVQFADESQEVIVSAFGCPQDPDVHPNQGEVSESDPRWLAFAETFPKDPFGG